MQSDAKAYQNSRGRPNGRGRYLIVGDGQFSDCPGDRHRHDPGGYLVINLGVAGDLITITNGPVVSGFQTTQVSSGTDSFETIAFANKTSVTVNWLGGDDTITINNTTAATGLINLTVNAGNGTDISP